MAYTPFPITPGVGSGGGGGSSVHNDLTGRSAADAHPTSAITGLDAALAAVKGGALGYVAHGATASTTRPSGFAAICWVGTVEPTNAVNGDIWEDPS